MTAYANPFSINALDPVFTTRMLPSKHSVYGNRLDIYSLTPFGEAWILLSS